MIDEFYVLIQSEKVYWRKEYYHILKYILLKQSLYIIIWLTFIFIFSLRERTLVSH